MNHPRDAMLHRFVEGDLGDDAAVHVALHLDACAACANRVRELEPLARAFASVDDPPLPADFVASVLAADTRPMAVVPWTDLAAGTSLIAAAAAAALFSEGTGAWLARARVLTDLATDGLATPWLSLALIGWVPLVVGLFAWNLRPAAPRATGVA